MTKAYRTVSNEALCIINGITPLNINIEEMGKLYEISKGGGINYDKEMEKESRNHQAFHIEIIERNADNQQNIQAYTDGSKSEAGFSRYCYITRQ